MVQLLAALINQPLQEDPLQAQKIGQMERKYQPRMQQLCLLQETRSLEEGMSWLPWTGEFRQPWQETPLGQPLVSNADTHQLTGPKCLLASITLAKPQLILDVSPRGTEFLVGTGATYSVKTHLLGSSSTIGGLMLTLLRFTFPLPVKPGLSL